MGPLFIKTEFTLLESTVRISSLMDNIKNKGFNVAAIADSDSMHGTIEFIKQAKQHAVTPIVGLDICVEFPDGKGRFICYARNNVAYKQLVKLSSYVMTMKERVIPFKNFIEMSSDVAVVSHPTDSIFHHYINFEAAACIPEKMEKLSRYINHFYIGVGCPASEKFKLDSNVISGIANNFNINVVFANKTTFIKKGDHETIELLEAIKNATTIKSTGKHDSNFLLSKDEITNCTTEKIISNTNALIEDCKFEFDFHKSELPKYPTPNNVAPKMLLRELCKKGLEKRLLGNVTQVYVDRLKHEIQIIESMKFEDYFLITWDFVKYAKQNGIVVGPGRGSAAGSLVAYCLGITGVDPIKYDLLFERFLNPERISMPDIDIDFQDTRRDEVIRYVHNKYGVDHVAHICTFQTLGAKSSLRDSGRALGVSLAMVDAISKTIPGTPGITLDEAYKSSLRMKELIHQNDMTERMFKLAKSIEGLPRQTGTHAAGIVLSNEKLSETVPMAEGYSGINMTQFSMNYLEDIGLLKMDFLGLRNLTIIDNIVNEIEKSYDEKIDINNIPLDDERTYKIIQAADTSGIFQLESPGMRKVLRQMKSDCFDDIVATIALFRPGPMANIPSYIARKHGNEEVSYIDKSLEGILSSTYGIIVYQEQIMQIAQHVADFSFGKADILRRAMGKKKISLMQKLEVEFIDGAVVNGYTSETAKSIYELIYKFANYGFNKSHSVAYALIGYQLSYLKANYPLQFMSSLLSSVIGNEKGINSYLLECKKYKIGIRGPSINKSFAGFVVESDEIRYSLVSIKNFGQAAYNKIIEERKLRGDFTDFIDFISRTFDKGINIKSVESLIWAGAFDEFGTGRTALINAIPDAKRYAQLARGKDGQIMMDLDVLPRPSIQDIKDAPEEILEKELAALGLYLSTHPISIIKTKLNLKVPIIDMCNLDGYNKKTVTVVGNITRVNAITTKKGDRMAFVMLADETGITSLTIFPRIYSQISELLKRGNMICVFGKAEAGEENAILVNGAKSVEELLKGR